MAIRNGGSGLDTLDGTQGSDVLNGGGGNDTLNGHEGDDTLNGGSGDDLLVGDYGSDVLNGGPGWDTANYVYTSADTVINLASGTALISTYDAEDETLSGIENVVTGAGWDTVTGDDRDNSLAGGGGDDSLDGGEGRDTVFGDDGDDYVSGGSGDDMVFGGRADDTLEGGPGADDLYGDDGRDTFYLTEGDGRDQVFSYEPGIDRIEVKDIEPGSYRYRDDGDGNTVVTWGDPDASLTLFGVQPGAFDDL